MTELLFVDLRGGSYAIENPTDVHIRSIQEFAQSSTSNRRIQKELAHALQSMMPSLPKHLASCDEYEQPDGSSLIRATFNLQVYELLEIAQVAAIGYCHLMIEKLKTTEPRDKTEAAKIRNRIVQLEKTIADDLKNRKSAILMILEGDEIPDALPNLDESLDQSPSVIAANGKPKPKALAVSQNGRS